VKQIDVFYNKTKHGKVPTQGYPGDFAYDMYVSKGTLVPPLTFKSIMVETDLRTAFDPVEVGMKISLRSGAAAKTPLVVPNTPGIVEGTYRDGLKILVRNSFIDSRLVDFAFTVEGKRIPVKDIPPQVLTRARQFYNEETELLGYEGVTPEVQEMVYKTHVPAGTVYIAKHDRIAQMHFQEKVAANFIPKEDLPDSVRGEKGMGSSGSSFVPGKGDTDGK
jgi:dUTPase